MTAPDQADPLDPEPAAARAAASRTEPAVPVPTDYDGVASALTRLLDSARGYQQAFPEAAAAGGWWNPLPLEQPPSTPTVDPLNARQAGVLVLMSCTGSIEGPRVLLTERATGLRKHPGQISFPGGSADDTDADIVATALRESQEETALDPRTVVVLGTLPPAPVPVSGFVVTPVLAVTRDCGVLTPSEDEVARVLQLPVKELVAAESRYSAVLMRDNVKLSSPAFWTNDSFVWGFTGILLDRILDRLGWAEPWDPDRELDPRQFRRD